MNQPPTGPTWQPRSPVGSSSATVAVTTFPSDSAAQTFLDDHWQAVHRVGDALFLRHLPSILGDPVGFSPTGYPAYRPTFQPPEVWFVTSTPLMELWSWAGEWAFLSASTAPAVVAACGELLADLAARHPLGLESVGERFAAFRRLQNGGAFTPAEMRRVCALNRQLTDEDDASHRDRSTPGHFVQGGFFWLGI